MTYDDIEYVHHYLSNDIPGYGLLFLNPFNCLAITVDNIQVFALTSFGILVPYICMGVDRPSSTSIKVGIKENVV